MKSVKKYKVFGIIIQSDLELETLDPAPDMTVTPDVIVKRITGLVRKTHSHEPHFDIQPDVQYFHWTAIGAYLIENDHSVLVELHEGTSDLLASHALLGLVMSVVLERRGLLSLHASAVSVAGRAVIFMGDKGAGKSTTTGAMLQRGHAPITDDLVPVDLPDVGAPFIHPGFSTTKLYPDSAAALGMVDDDTDREIHHSTIKKQKQMMLPVTPDATPVGALCVLRRSSEENMVRFETLPAHAALQAVMRFTFKARYGETRMGRDSLVRHMKLCSGLVARAPVYELFIPEDLTRLNDLATAIEDHMKSSFEQHGA